MPIAVVKKFSGKAPEGYQDFRRVLDRPDIDAIFAPTPDHWHPLMTILGLPGGKRRLRGEARVAHGGRGPRDGRGRTAGTGGSSSSAPSSGR